MPRVRKGVGPGTHTLAFLLLTGRDEIGLERGPNKDMSVVVCVQPKEHPRIEEAKKKVRRLVLGFHLFSDKKKSRHLLQCESRGQC